MHLRMRNCCWNRKQFLSHDFFSNFLYYFLTICLPSFIIKFARKFCIFYNDTLLQVLIISPNYVPKISSEWEEKNHIEKNWQQCFQNKTLPVIIIKIVNPLHWMTSSTMPVKTNYHMKFLVSCSLEFQVKFRDCVWNFTWNFAEISCINTAFHSGLLGWEFLWNYAGKIQITSHWVKSEICKIHMNFSQTMTWKRL